MRVLALITARGGSKRLPGKNIRQLGGKPLLVWSIDAAKHIPEICSILVSTDDCEIADIAQKAGGFVPWLRPGALSTDTASSMDVALHALDWFENKYGAVDGLMLLQPTSPFRSEATIKRAIELFLANDHRSVIGVSPAASHPAWCYRIEGDALLSIGCDGLGSVHSRSQDLPVVYVVNGAMYLTAPAFLREKHVFYEDNACPLIIEDSVESLDIDTALDFMVAECIVAGMFDSSEA